MLFILVVGCCQHIQNMIYNEIFFVHFTYFFVFALPYLCAYRARVKNIYFQLERYRSNMRIAFFDTNFLHKLCSVYALLWLVLYRLFWCYFVFEKCNFRTLAWVKSRQIHRISVFSWDKCNFSLCFFRVLDFFKLEAIVILIFSNIVYIFLVLLDVIRLFIHSFLLSRLSSEINLLLL